MTKIVFPPIPLPSIDTWPNTPEKLRARDLEVARVVRDRIADIMDAGGYRSQITAISIRKLEFGHE